jgi:hypothetical protein
LHQVPSTSLKHGMGRIITYCVILKLTCNRLVVAISSRFKPHYIAGPPKRIAQLSSCLGGTKWSLVLVASGDVHIFVLARCLSSVRVVFFVLFAPYVQRPAIPDMHKVHDPVHFWRPDHPTTEQFIVPFILLHIVPERS